jgi:hypothetical protein
MFLWSVMRLIMTLRRHIPGDSKPYIHRCESPEARSSSWRSSSLNRHTEHGLGSIWCRVTWLGMVLASRWLTGRWSLQSSANVLHKVAPSFLLPHRTRHAQQQVQFLEIAVLYVVQRKSPRSQPSLNDGFTFRKRVAFIRPERDILSCFQEAVSLKKTLILGNVKNDKCINSPLFLGTGVPEQRMV